jgi:Cu-processing system ATP-binding protein
MELCRLNDIHMRYRKEEVLRGLGLGLPKHGIIGLVGENGSGKSTLLKILAGILRPDSGTLQAPAGRPRVGYMPENCQWYPHLSGAQVLRYFARFTGASSRDQEHILKQVGLWPARDKKLGAYSKGMRQKLGLAQAISGDPDLLVLDEPTNGLDPRGIIDFYHILRQRVEAGGTAILSSHLLTELEGRITHVAFLHGGRIIASGACEELLEKAGLGYRIQWHQPAADGWPTSLEKLAADRAWIFAGEGGTFEIILPKSELALFLHQLPARHSPGSDLKISPPTLEDLYLHLMAPPPAFKTNGKLPSAVAPARQLP